MPPGSPVALVEQLRRVPLLEPAKLAELPRLARSCNDGAALLDHLKRLGWLTDYQAGQLAAGRVENLQFASYVILDSLGQGAAGQVFKARHAVQNHLVALKVIPAESLSGRQVRRFEREVEAARRLQHPHIVPAYEAGQAGRYYFLAMEFVDGIDLSRLVKQNGPLPWRLACDLIRQAALGLQHAHELGFVHRDIKPANLMLIRSATAAPTIKLLDFGLARFATEGEGEGRLTQAGRLLGTVDYIAPEQAEDARKADYRSDLYSLGATLFYLLTAKPPFPGRDLVERLGARVTQEVRPPSSMKPDLPREMDALVGWMMARRPESRPVSAAQVAATLEPFGLSAQPAKVVEDATMFALQDSGPMVQARTRPRKRSNWLNRALAGMLILTLIAGGAWLLRSTIRPRDRSTGDNPGVKDGGQKPETLLVAAAPVMIRPAEVKAAALDPKLVANLKSDVQKTQIAALQKLAYQMGPHNADLEPLLSPLLEGKTKQQGKLIAAYALCNIRKGNEDTLGRVLKQTWQQQKKATKPNAGTQARTLAALASLGARHLPDVADLRAAIKSSNPGLTRAAALALGVWGPKAADAVRDLALKVRDSRADRETRLYAAEALVAIGQTSARDALDELKETLARDNDPAIRLRCLWALSRVEDIERAGLVGTLTELVNNPKADKQLRYQAALLLAARLRTKAPAQTTNVLLQLLRDASVALHRPPVIRVADRGAEVRHQAGEDARHLAVGAILACAPESRYKEITKELEHAAEGEGKVADHAKRGLRQLRGK